MKEKRHKYFVYFVNRNKEVKERKKLVIRKTFDII